MIGQEKVQPDILHINTLLRLKRPNVNDYDKALPWYSDPYVMKMSEGISDRCYNRQDIQVMYDFLSEHGELYFIELKVSDELEEWLAIGDVTLMENNLPIVIDPEYTRQGIGKKVMMRIIGRGIELGMTYFKVPEVYIHNEPSQKLFESLGFKELGRNDSIISYYYEI